MTELALGTSDPRIREMSAWFLYFHLCFSFPTGKHCLLSQIGSLQMVGIMVAGVLGLRSFLHLSDPKEKGIFSNFIQKTPGVFRMKPLFTYLNILNLM